MEQGPYQVSNMNDYDDYPKCSICDHDYYETHYCDGCKRNWCDGCEYRVQQFMFNNTMRCTLCWQRAPDKPDPDKIITYAAKKLKMTYNELYDEYCADYASCDYYYCTACPPKTCANTECTRVAENIPAEYSDRERGYCCVYQIREFDQDETYMCDGCKRWQARRVAITLLCIHRFRRRRKTAGLTQVPKDVLRHHIIKTLFSK